MSKTPKSDAIIKKFGNAHSLYTTRSVAVELGTLCREFEQRNRVLEQLVDELDAHEGAEGWSEELRVKLRKSRGELG